MKLKALRPVLYLAHQYDRGDELPVNNPDMVEAWLEAGSAESKWNRPLRKPYLLQRWPDNREYLTEERKAA